ncbi:MAG: hypothetical protein Q7S10_02970 [bacterium]|nr:hypothetical protein [bacterium]
MAEQEIKVCQNCKSSFTIESDDFAFYEKMKVPAPTWCPNCRMARRFSWRNERTLHHGKCAATGVNIITGFAPDLGYTIYERDYWWSDKWDPLACGQEYDDSKPFFEQFDQLMHQVPHPSVFNSRTVNCDYVQHTGEYKDGYLVSASWEGENVAYASRCNNAKDCMDMFEVFYCTLGYEDISCVKLYNTHFSFRSQNCNDSWFLFDCKSCSNCFGCWNLRNKSYYIFNKPYSKEEYKRKMAELDMGSFKNLEDAKVKFQDIKKQALHKFATLINAPESTGDNLENVKNCKTCFGFWGDVRDCKYCMNGGVKSSDMYDGYGVGANAELVYEAFDSGVQGSRQMFVGIVYGCNSVTYCYNCTGSSNLFGCIGLRNKQYCILNKQYTKEEYEKIVAKIKGKMLDDGEYGEFFPTKISPFGYNETVAQDYFPLTKEEALVQGYKWRDPSAPSYKSTIKAHNLPDHIKDVNDGVLKEIIECADCSRPYRIVKRELEFLKHLNIALPRKCFECRHQNRFHHVNFPRLFNRSCMCNKSHQDHIGQCPNKFETSYAPDRSEAVYCEQCYQAEVV